MSFQPREARKTLIENEMRESGPSTIKRAVSSGVGLFEACSADFWVVRVVGEAGKCRDRQYLQYCPVL